MTDSDMQWLISACFGMAAAADALLTGALIIVLRKSRTGFNGYVHGKQGPPRGTYLTFARQNRLTH